MENHFKNLGACNTADPSDFGDGDSILTLLYETYADCNRIDDDRIKEDFNELYKKMNGMTLTQMDTLLDPVCSLCRDHQRSGFV